MTYTHRIRRCNGDKSSWCLVMLFDGRESTCAACYKTGPTIDSLLKHTSGGLHCVNLKPTDRVELVIS